MALFSYLDHPPPTHSQAFSFSVVQFPHPNCYPPSTNMCGAPHSHYTFFLFPPLQFCTFPSLGFKEKLRIWQVPACQLSCQSISTCIFECGPHTLGELVLSLKSNGDTNPALLELCHTRDFKAIFWWIGAAIFLEIWNLFSLVCLILEGCLCICVSVPVCACLCVTSF